MVQQGFVLAQKFNLSLDLGDYYACVFDRKLREADCKQHSVPRRLFNRHGSTTFKQKTPDGYPYALGSDQYFVSFVTSSFRLGDFTRVWQSSKFLA